MYVDLIPGNTYQMGGINTGSGQYIPDPGNTYQIHGIHTGSMEYILDS